MKSGCGRGEINPVDHPEGYITDIFNAEYTMDKTKVVTDNMQLRIFDLPDIATITFNIELLNITGSQSPRFEIRTAFQQLATMDVNYTINDMHLLTFPVGDKVERYVELTYYMKNLQINAEQVRIKYNGKSHTPHGKCLSSHMIIRGFILAPFPLSIILLSHWCKGDTTKDF